VRVSIVHGLTGALVAAVLFEVTKGLFSRYIANYANYDVVYGALSTLPILLIWVYLSWVVTLIGAELVAVLQERHLLEIEVGDLFHQADSGSVEESAS
jgi:membrane protein